MTNDEERFSIQDVPMHVFRFVGPLAVGAIAVALVSAAGCPSSVEKSGAAKPQSSEAKQSLADEPAALSKPPVEEFQQPPTLPPSDPPPKLAQEPIDEPKVFIDRTTVPSAFEQDTNVPADKSAAPPEKTAMQPRATKVARKPFDPIEVNGRYFVGWPKPKVAIAITGMEQGYIEPCGCAGMDRMTGGISRRYAFFQDLRKKGWPTVALDVGDLAKPDNFGLEAEMKFHTLVESKQKMGYDAVAFGPDDLHMPVSELILVAADVNDKPSMFLAANVGLLGFDQKITQTSRVIKAGGMRIGVTAILGNQYRKGINVPEIEMCDPEAALKKIVPELKRNADYLVLLANATQEEAIDLAKKFPDFNAVVVAEGAEVPPPRRAMIKGTQTLLISVGHKGMSVIVLGLYDGQPVRYQRVLLDSRFDASPDTRLRASPEMKRLMAEYQDKLRDIGFTKLGLNPAPHPLADSNGRFVGSQKCESCHEKSYYIWKRSGHGHAYATLEDLDPPRNFDPECVSCHVVGWHPTKFFPYQSGFESPKKTPHLKNAGCEGCHGPGEKHCDAELTNDEQLQKKYRKGVVITKEQSKKEQCTTCHDLDNSPEFDFDKYWPLIEHHEEHAE
jgi:Cytochrome c554 and c-prime